MLLVIAVVVIIVCVGCICMFVSPYTQKKLPQYAEDVAPETKPVLNQQRAWSKLPEEIRGAYERLGITKDSDTWSKLVEEGPKGSDARKIVKQTYQHFVRTKHEDKGGDKGTDMNAVKSARGTLRKEGRSNVKVRY